MMKSQAHRVEASLKEYTSEPGIVIIYSANVDQYYRFNARDPVAGKLYMFVLTLLYLIYLLLCWWRPQQVHGS